MKNHLLKKKKVMSKIYKLYRLSIADQFEILIFYTGIIKKKEKGKEMISHPRWIGILISIHLSLLIKVEILEKERSNWIHSFSDVGPPPATWIPTPMIYETSAVTKEARKSSGHSLSLFYVNKQMISCNTQRWKSQLYHLLREVTRQLLPGTESNIKLGA